MREVWIGAQTIFAAIGGFIGWYIGGLDEFIYILLIFMTVDYITGVMCAVLDKKLSSQVGYRGLFKKALILVVVGIGHVIDNSVIGAGEIVRTTVICFYISNEGMSFLENAAQIGLPIPKKLKGILLQLHKE